MRPTRGSRAGVSAQVVKPPKQDTKVMVQADSVLKWAAKESFHHFKDGATRPIRYSNIVTASKKADMELYNMVSSLKAIKAMKANIFFSWISTKLATRP